MRHLKIAGIVAAASLSSPTTAKQLNSTYYNPIIPGWHSDPSCIQHEGTFFCTSSTFLDFPGLPIYASTDLINWKQVSNVWNRESQILGINNASTSRPAIGFLAPNLRFHGGLFYVTCVYGGDEQGLLGTVFTTASIYSDHWSDPVTFRPGGLSIDPEVFWDDDGSSYLLLSGITISTIDLKTGELGDPVSIWNGSAGVTFPEGPHMYKKDGWYYLM
jgi:beta-xylosidase